ncbi:MAG: DUF3427 domain-containing protein [Clostridiales bacterium]|nr:DUF3427 domain-containing protein [Clostridiales bacterium]
MLENGLYEQVINKAIEKELSSDDRISKTEKLDSAEASKILATYVADIVEKKLNELDDRGCDMEARIDFVNEIISSAMKSIEDSDDLLSISDRAEQLLALYDKKNSILAVDEKQDIVRPVTSLSRSSIFTGASKEPQMFTELKKEIVSCDRIEMLVSFIKWSGLRLIIDELKTFTQRGGELSIITTSYMGATDVKAVKELSALPNTRVKVSYDTKTTRLHAKAYIFYRDTGFTTAYVGSSNMSNAALTSGLEWNLKITQKDSPDTIKKITATFENYWNSSEFEYYDEGQQERLARALKAEKYYQNNDRNTYTIDVKPYSYQQEILDKLEAERKIRGYYRNLVVAATGTGKTVIAAFDYKRYLKENPGKSCRLLFVAHREEILEQARSTFRSVLKDPNFGELFVGSNRPSGIDHLFMSIQTFNSRDFTTLTTSDFYQFIIVDEFHHAAAPSYKKLLEYYKPEILLGLTATPERMDGKSVLEYFGNRIAAEIRLPEAIDRKLLCPFQYFGVSDTVDLDQLKWTAGGYDRTELNNIYTFSGFAAEKRADLIFNSVLKYVTDVDDVKALGFCVQVEHARFMREWFNSHGINSMYLSGDSPDEERWTAKKRLVSGEIKVIFVVDIYNEGVDIPEVNTVLFLRPTQSLTIFLQQLGRGLRLSEGKECLTVLDFIGQANKKYSFESKFAALLSDTSRGVTREIKDGFISVPKGCYIQLEKKASKVILENIRASYGNTAGLISKIASFEEDTGKGLSLPSFLEHYRLDPRNIYKYSTFSRLCVRADVKEDFSVSQSEERIQKALSKFSVIDSRRWITYIRSILKNLKTLDYEKMSLSEKRMFQMFYVTIFNQTITDWKSPEFLSSINDLANSDVLLQEMDELLQYKFDQIDFVDEPVNLGFECPLDLHCTYTRDQLLVALDFLKPSTVREGVKWLDEKKLDVFFVTLNKSDKDYSPTTLYDDYSISEELFHWQSQSTTSSKSKTGQRYIHHTETGSKVLLFVREFKTERQENGGGAGAYTFLGTANYVTHTGDCPMSITWRLDRPIPAKFLKKTNKLMIG